MYSAKRGPSAKLHIYVFKENFFLSQEELSKIQIMVGPYLIRIGTLAPRFFCDIIYYLVQIVTSLTTGKILVCSKWIGVRGGYVKQFEHK